MVPPVKSRFITILSTVSIMLAFFSIAQGISTLSLQNSMEFGIAGQVIPSAIISPVAIYFEIILNIAGIVASMGLFMRQNWGRIMYMIVLSLFTVWNIYSSISSYYTVNELMNAYGMGSSLSLILFWSVLGVGINIYLLWKLSSDNIRQEFEKREETPSL